MDLPDEVAVMSLPNAILFPRVLLPLYIFEQRYRQMLADSLAGNRLFAVGLLQDGWEKHGSRAKPYPVVGVGVIRTCVGRPDGTSNLILEGVARVQILKYVRHRPYPVARIEPLPSHKPATPLPRAALVAAVNKLAKARARLGAEVPAAVLSSLLAVQNADHLSDLVSYTLLDDFHEKQRMLETLDVDQRLTLLVELLQKRIRQFELWKTLQGKLGPNDVGRN